MLPFLAAMAPFAPLIGAGIGALGALLAPKPAPQIIRETSSFSGGIDFEQFRIDAEAAGFNPIGAMRAGGLSGYAFGTGSSTTHMPALADNRLSNALQIFGSGVSQWTYDPLAARRSEVELKLAEATLQHFSKTGAPGNMSLGVPGFTAPGTVYQASPFGMDPMLVANPNMAADAEDHFGEIGDIIYGVGNWIDSVTQAWERSMPKWREELGLPKDGVGGVFGRPTWTPAIPGAGTVTYPF